MFFIVKAMDKRVEHTLNNWHKNRARPELSKFFVRKLERGIFLLEANGEILAHLWTLNLRYPTGINIFYGNLMQEWDIPREIKEVSEWLAEKTHGRKPESKNLPSMEILREITMTSSIDVQKPY